jgi:hypothetical protein
MTNQQLAILADIYIPLLVLLTILSLLKKKKISDIKLPTYPVKAKIIALLLCTFMTYIVMFVDGFFGIWQQFSADYSTHTALALVFVTCLMIQGKRKGYYAISSLLVYCALMDYQKYHTWLDMISTSAVLFPGFYYIHKNTKNL